ncbi:MAG TPA: hypothetical protein VFU90_07530 [Candidatus Tumulicola sp.]|nr:hypothetical protein [Candidatus Tumulicola sp.]
MSEAIKQPASFQVPSSYPTTYSITHDAAQRVTRVTLDSLVAR